MNFEELATKPMVGGRQERVDLLSVTRTASAFYDFLTLNLKLKTSAMKFYDLIVSANAHKSTAEIMRRLTKIQIAPTVTFISIHEAVVILSHYGFDCNVETNTITDMRKLQNTKGGN